MGEGFLMATPPKNGMREEEEEEEGLTTIEKFPKYYNHYKSSRFLLLFLWSRKSVFFKHRRANYICILL